MGKGIHIKGNTSRPQLINNLIEGSKYGIYVDGCAPTIGDSADNSSDNWITDNTTTGIYVTGSGATPLIRNNHLDGNYNGVVGISNGNPNLGTSASNGNNAITSTGNYCVWNRTTGGGAPDIKACGNWWGSNSPPGCTNGNVTACNWLGYAPSSIWFDTEPCKVGDVVLSIQSVSPDPSSGPTRVRLVVAGASAHSVDIEVFDLSGRLVATVFNGHMGQGVHEVTWDGVTTSGRPASSGAYFVRASVGGSPVAVKRMLVVK